MKGIVYKSTGSWFIVKDNSGKFWNARLKGVMKLDAITSTNPLAVGDEVEIAVENEKEDTVIVTEIFPRKNYINRQSPRQKHQQHIIASNIDQSILLATLKSPRTSQGFIDRFAVVCEMYHIPLVIVINKSDLHSKKEEDQFNLLQKMYAAVGYKVLLTSVNNNAGIEEMKTLLENKISLISGHSGVGKSSIINLLCPKLNLKTNEISSWSGKGLHTTTFAEMHELPTSGKIIDTPGMREFGIIGVEKEELSHYFPEMRRLLSDCKFNNCLHINEQDCAIKKAVAEDKINIDRYNSYCNIFDSLDGKKY